MELPPGVRCHADMVRKLAGQPLELSEVLPLYLHRYAIFTNCPNTSPGFLISKFREIDSQLFEGLDVHKAAPELLHLADLIDPPTLRPNGFNAYLRREFSDFVDEFPERTIPDLWFGLE